MVNAKAIWSLAIGLSIAIHFVIVVLFYQDSINHGDDGYLEVELSLDDPKDDPSTQTKLELPAPPQFESFPTMPEHLEIVPPEIDLTPTLDLAPESLSELPAISLDIDYTVDSFDVLGDASTIKFGTGVTEESARQKGSESVETNYLKRVSAHIHRFKIYPREARVAKQEGTVIVQLTLNEDGSVQAKNVTSSSGVEMLDEEALKIVSRADPLPKFPSALVEIIGTELTISTAINFKLNDSD